ncbi:uncharacterized protein [Asterias amurensis]|uniref:uncharacterized protein n=1 Tax=Asterias amurensis TaxID=7602 RepID=UPI003AB8867B
MGSRPSSNYNGRNGTMANEAETALRTENTQLKEKLNALKEFDPVRIQQENEELRRINKDLNEQLEELRISTPASRPSETDSNDYQRNNSINSSAPTKEKDRSSRKQISKLVAHKMSDIDAYGQGIPLEKHPPIKIKNHRKKNKKKEPTEDVCTDAVIKELTNDDVINGATAGTPSDKPTVVQEAQDISEPDHANADKKSCQESDLLS